MNKNIFNYLKEEINCYEEILSLSKRQKDTIVNGNDDILMEIIREKEILIEKVKEIDKNLTTPKSGSRESENWSQTGVLLKKIESILNEINKIENECREIVANKMKDISYKMKELRTGKQIASIYLEKSIYIPKFINMKK